MASDQIELPAGQAENASAQEENALRARLKQTQPFEGEAQQTMLSLMVAGAAVEGEIEQACASFDLSASHYNVLRILAGGPLQGYARCDIIERMIDRGPDVTRLMDRLEKKGLVHRQRSEADRRVTLHRITEQGRGLLEEMRADIQRVQRRFTEHITDDEQRTLTRLCAKVYGIKS